LKGKKNIGFFNITHIIKSIKLAAIYLKKIEVDSGTKPSWYSIAKKEPPQMITTKE
tara:strand:- start:440 stop:607 length:168 start_codon:yes stop_codon:yes gene_type:complete